MLIAFTGQRYKIWKQITTQHSHSGVQRWLLLLVKDTKFESKSQLKAAIRLSAGNCFYWSKIQNLKANHNVPFSMEARMRIAFTGQRYKIWKQITTQSHLGSNLGVLLLLVKDTKFESKSQPGGFSFFGKMHCFYWSKIQNLKANHNAFHYTSQTGAIAFTGQRYKIWKQITTIMDIIKDTSVLLLLVKDTKFESKSQHLSKRLRIASYCFYWSKIQNLKANHNLTSCTPRLWAIAFTGQRYKIWKQITTSRNRILTNFYCFYWSKIQNLKANHNNLPRIIELLKIAFTGQRYKIWKQITTSTFSACSVVRLLLLVKDTKFESKSQQAFSGTNQIDNCFYWSKIQNLKANHNKTAVDQVNGIIAFTGQSYKIWKRITTHSSDKPTS